MKAPDGSSILNQRQGEIVFCALNFYLKTNQLVVSGKTVKPQEITAILSKLEVDHGTERSEPRL